MGTSTDQPIKVTEAGWGAGSYTPATGKLGNSTLYVHLSGIGRDEYYSIIQAKDPVKALRKILKKAR